MKNWKVDEQYNGKVVRPPTQRWKGSTNRCVKSEGVIRSIKKGLFGKKSKIKKPDTAIDYDF